MYTPSVRKSIVVLCGFMHLVLVLAFLLPHKAQAQTLYGSLVGNVKDPTGAAVPKATVTATNKGTNQTHEAITDDSGGYSFTGIQTGTYSVKISLQGFKTFEQTDVTVSLNTVNRVDITLQVGEVSETISVTGRQRSFKLTPLKCMLI